MMSLLDTNIEGEDNIVRLQEEGGAGSMYEDAEYETGKVHLHVYDFDDKIAYK